MRAVLATHILMLLALGPAHAATRNAASTVPGDDCTAPIAISGGGQFSVTTQGASAGTQGQTEALCLASGTTAIDQDVWFDWVAPSAGTATVTLCGSAHVDPKVAVYAGAGCPSAPAIACNDDACGTKSELTFPIVYGAHYSIQIGTRPGTPGATGASFRIRVTPPPTACGYDDGTAEVALGGSVQPGELVWLQRFGSPGTTTSITGLWTAWGYFPSSPGFPNGAPATLAVWDDPDEDGDPTNAVLLWTSSVQVASTGTGTFLYYPLPAAQSLDGFFFVGASAFRLPDTYPAPADRSTTSQGRGWWAFEAGTANLANLAANSWPPRDNALTPEIDGVWLIRVECQPALGAFFCPGDGSGTACPCGNSGSAGNGCASSVNASGGRLRSTGEARISNDTVILYGSGMPNTSCLYFQGTLRQNGGQGAVFGDGLRCAGGGVVRLGTTTNANGFSRYPGAGAPSVSIRGQLPAAGGTRTYQAWYRNAIIFCTPSTFNLTNGVELTWVP